MSSNPILDGLVAGAGLAQKSADARQRRYEFNVRADQYDRGLSFKQKQEVNLNKRHDDKMDFANDDLDQSYNIWKANYDEQVRATGVNEDQRQQGIDETIRATKEHEKLRDRVETKQSMQWQAGHNEGKRQWQETFNQLKTQSAHRMKREHKLDSLTEAQQRVINNRWETEWARIMKLDEKDQEIALRQLALQEHVGYGQLEILQGRWQQDQAKWKQELDEKTTSALERNLGSNNWSERNTQREFAQQDQRIALDKTRITNNQSQWQKNFDQNADVIEFNQDQVEKAWEQSLTEYATNEQRIAADREHTQKIQKLQYRVSRDNADYNKSIQVSAQEKRQAYDINADLFSLRDEPRAFIERVNEYGQKHPEQFSLLLDESISEMTGGARSGESIDGTGRFTKFALSADGKSVILGNAENGSMYTGATDPDAPGVRENQGTPVAIPIEEFQMQIMRRMNAAGEHPAVQKELDAYDTMQEVKNFESPQSKQLGRQQANVQGQMNTLDAGIAQNYAQVSKLSGERRRRDGMAQRRSDARNPKLGKEANRDWQSTFADQDGWVFDDSAEDLANNTKILTKLAQHDPVAALKGIRNQQEFVEGRLEEGGSAKDMAILKKLKTQLQGMESQVQRDVSQQRGIGDAIRPEDLSPAEYEQLSRYKRMEILKKQKGRITDNMLDEGDATKFAKDNVEAWLNIYKGSPKEVADNFAAHGVLKTGSYFFDMEMKRIAELKASKKADQLAITKFLKAERADGRKFVDGFKNSKNDADKAFYGAISENQSMRLPNFNRAIAATLRRGYTRLYYMDKNNGGHGDITLDESGSLTQLSSLGYFMRSGDWSDNALDNFKQVNTKLQAAYDRLGYERRGIDYLAYTGKIAERLASMIHDPNDPMSRADAMDAVLAELKNGQR